MLMINLYINRTSKLEIANQCDPIRLRHGSLRIGDLRVYYDFSEEPKKVVYVRAIGIKDRNIVRIGGEEIQL